MSLSGLTAGSAGLSRKVVGADETEFFFLDQSDRTGQFKVTSPFGLVTEDDQSDRTGCTAIYL